MIIYINIMCVHTPPRHRITNADLLIYIYTAIYETAADVLSLLPLLLLLLCTGAAAVC